MRRVALAASLPVACVLAGAFGSAVRAAVPPPPATSLSTSLASATGRLDPRILGTDAAGRRVVPAEAALPGNVWIAGVAVGGLTPLEAYATVRAAFSQPLALVAGGRAFTVAPDRLGVIAYARGAVRRALASRPRGSVDLTVRVDGRRVRAFVASLARQLDHKPLDATLRLRNLQPWISPERPGVKLDQGASARLVVAALQANRRGPIALPGKVFAAKVTQQSFGSVIVIRRGSRHLFIYHGMRLVRDFGVAVGQARYPTPIGRFQIVVKARNPWWYPPSSDWARSLKPIPPGRGNPLGTRWMGISAPGVGIHGTPDDASIGYSLSHGCVRMHIPDAEWLFSHVSVGTAVFIVPA